MYVTHFVGSIGSPRQIRTRDKGVDTVRVHDPGCHGINEIASKWDEKRKGLAAKSSSWALRTETGRNNQKGEQWTGRRWSL